MKPAKFSDCTTSQCLDLPSEWKRGSSSSRSAECQTDSELFQTSEMDTQTGQSTNIYQEIVSGKSEGMTLFERFSKFSERTAEQVITLLGSLYMVASMNFKSNAQWNEVIEDGFISIDGEVVRDSGRVLREEELVEYVNYKHHVHTQTQPEARPQIQAKGPSDIRHTSDAKSGGDYDNDVRYESEEKDVKDSVQEAVGGGDRVLDAFLRRVLPTVEAALIENLSSSAFEGYELIEEPGSDVVSHWKTLTVDLEKCKVTYPDWSNAKYYNARVHSSSLTRNKERVYDIEFDDGGNLSGVREVSVLFFTYRLSLSHMVYHVYQLIFFVGIHSRSRRPRCFRGHSSPSAGAEEAAGSSQAP